MNGEEKSKILHRFEKTKKQRTKQEDRRFVKNIHQSKKASAL
jgi:hypothetical protein